MPFEHERIAEGEEELYRPKPVEFEDEVLDEDLLVSEVKRSNEDTKEDFTENILNILAEKQIEMSEREKAAIMQLIKGNHTDYTIHTALSVCMRRDPDAVQKIAKEFIS